MNQTQATFVGPERIAPVGPQEHRPFWSVMIPTYNCAKYLVKTLESVLEQDPGPAQMQIEVVDDVSTNDNPEDVVREIGKGRVQFFRQPKNVRPTRNFNTCLHRSRGHWVHILHGDDFVLPGFYDAIRRECAASDAALICTRAFVVDEDEAVDSLNARIKNLETPRRDVAPFMYGNPFLTPSVVIRRTFYEAEGGFRQDLVHVSDWEMFVRAIRLGGGIAINQPMACYRLFSSNDTGRLTRTGENLRDYLRLSKIFATDLADFDEARFRAMVASRAREQADAARQRGDVEAANANEHLWAELISDAQPAPEKAKWLLKQILPPGLLALSRLLRKPPRLA